MNLSRMAIVPQFFHKRVVKSRPCCLHLEFIRICCVLYRDESDRKFDTAQTISAMSLYQFCCLIDHYQIAISIIVTSRKKRVLWQIFHHFLASWLQEISLSTWNVNRFSESIVEWFGKIAKAGKIKLNICKFPFLFRCQYN